METRSPESSDKYLLKLSERVEDLINRMDKMQIAEYIELMHRPFRMMAINFFAGLARGIGFGVGATILAAIILIVLGKLVGLPLIGGFIAQIVRIVHQQL